MLGAVHCAGSRGNSGIDEYEVLELRGVATSANTLIGGYYASQSRSWAMGDQPGEKINFAKC